MAANAGPHPASPAEGGMPNRSARPGRIALALILLGFAAGLTILLLVGLRMLSASSPATQDRSETNQVVSQTLRASSVATVSVAPRVQDTGPSMVTLASFTARGNVNRLTLALAGSGILALVVLGLVFRSWRASPRT